MQARNWAEILRPVVLKVFFTFLPYKPKLCQFLPNKDHKWLQLQKFHATYFEETLDVYEPNRFL